MFYLWITLAFIGGIVGSLSGIWIFLYYLWKNPQSKITQNIMHNIMSTAGQMVARGIRNA